MRSTILASLDGGWQEAEDELIMLTRLRDLKTMTMVVDPSFILNLHLEPEFNMVLHESLNAEILDWQICPREMERKLSDTMEACRRQKAPAWTPPVVRCMVSRIRTARRSGFCLWPARVRSAVDAARLASDSLAESRALLYIPSSKFSEVL